ncbi:hypothetical protein KCU92_g6134, partial [Aureobasidium melanogenum]
MLAPYANVEAFMKEWRSRAPPTHRGFGNQSSAAITSNNQSSALLAINRNPQESYTMTFLDDSDYGGATNAGKVYGIVFGTLGGIILLSGIIGTWLLIHYTRKTRRQASEETAGDVTAGDVTARDVTARDVTARDVTARDVTARDVTGEHVDEAHISPDSTYGSLSASSSPPASSSPNAPVQQPETQVRRANSPGAIDGPTSTPSSPPPSGAVVENWVESVILPRQPGGILAVRSPLTNMR